MLIQYELEGDQSFHRGIFDTAGFWVKCDKDLDDVTGEILTYKMWSNLHFAFETADKEKFDGVYDALTKVLSAKARYQEDVKGVGFFRILNL